MTGDTAEGNTPEYLPGKTAISRMDIWYFVINMREHFLCNPLRVCSCTRVTAVSA